MEAKVLRLGLVLAAGAQYAAASVAPPPGIVFSTNGRCGKDHGNTVCQDSCCSRWGWCGGGPQWCSCDAGCTEAGGGRCGFPVDKKLWGEHFCSVPDDLDGKFKGLFPEVTHVNNGEHTDVGSDIKKLVRSLDRGINPISVEKLFSIASTAKQHFPNLSWKEFAHGILAIHEFFPDDDAQICNAVSTVADNFNHPTFAAITRDFVIMQTATKEELTLQSITEQTIALKNFASRSDTAVNVKDMDNLAEAVASLGRAFEHFTLRDLHEFMQRVDNRYSGVSFSELAESLSSLKDMSQGMTLQQMADSLDRFAQDWNSPSKLPLDQVCDALTTLHYAYGKNTNLGMALTSLITLKRTFEGDASEATIPWIKKEMLRLQHGTFRTIYTLADVTNSIVAIKNELYGQNQKVSLPQIVEYVLIMYQNFGKQEPTLKSLIDKAKDAGKTFHKYSVGAQDGSMADDPFFDAQALSVLGQHFAKTQSLPLNEVVKTFEALHNKFKSSTIPAMCRDLITLQYSGDNLGTIVSWVEKVFDNNAQKWKDLPHLNFDDMAAGFKAMQGHGTFVQNCERYMSGNQAFHDFVKDAQAQMHNNQLGAPGQAQPTGQQWQQHNPVQVNSNPGSVGVPRSEGSGNVYNPPSHSNEHPAQQHNNYNSYNAPSQPYEVPGTNYAHDNVNNIVVVKEGHSWLFWFFWIAVFGAIYYYWPVILAAYNNRKFNGAFDNLSHHYSKVNLGFEMPAYGSGFAGVSNGDEGDLL